MARKAKKKYPPNPLPCGCGAKGVDVSEAIDASSRWGHIHAVHCQLHGAAPDLLAACERVITFERFKRTLGDENRAASYLSMLDTLRAAIAKARGKS